MGCGLQAKFSYLWPVPDTLLQMRALRSHLAVLLLLCFVRVLLPDAWVLALHAHEHTAELEPGRVEATKAVKAVLSAKHQHCQTDHFCTLPFQVAPVLEFGLPTAYSRPQATPPASVWAKTCPAARLLRGPPAGA
jgi:hypothetical protein